jgi:8-oxo-dGTP diphosphatase
MFSNDMSNVLLIFKRHGPPCVVGRWNGVGGKIETDESPHQAMVREFKEETGLTTDIAEWSKFLVLTSGTAIVHFLWAANDACMIDYDTVTDEDVKSFDVEKLPQVVVNITWMVPFLCDPFTVHELGELAMAGDPVV